MDQGWIRTGSAIEGGGRDGRDDAASRLMEGREDTDNSRCDEMTARLAMVNSYKVVTNFNCCHWLANN